MLDFLRSVHVESLLNACADQLEELIIIGKFPVGKRLPSQRVLAQQLDVSRSVVQEALSLLAAKGLVEMVPRVGTIVNDYRKKGTIAILASLFKHQHKEVTPRFNDSLLELRFLVEMEFARLAALNRTDEHVGQLREIITKKSETDPTDMDTLAALDFRFHHVLAMATANQVYPLLLNSFKNVFMNMAATFHSSLDVFQTSIGFQRDLTDAIKKQDVHLATAAMRCMLSHSEESLIHLRRAVSEAI